MTIPKKGDIGYIKSYRGTYAIRRKDGSWKEIFQDKGWDQSMNPAYFSARVRTFKRQLYKYIVDGRKIPTTLLEPIRLPQIERPNIEVEEEDMFPDFELKKKDRLKTWID